MATGPGDADQAESKPSTTAQTKQTAEVQSGAAADADAEIAAAQEAVSASPALDASGADQAAGGTPGDAADVASFWVAVYRSFLVIVFLEIGDRTFFIAALLSAKHPQAPPDHSPALLPARPAVLRTALPWH